MIIPGDKAVEVLSWEACPRTRDFETCQGFWLNHLIPNFCVLCWKYYFSCISVNRDYRLDVNERRSKERVVLNDKQWKAFMKALDAPPRSHARMKRLLNESSILDE